jgi:hypothetical protein
MNECIVQYGTVVQNDCFDPSRVIEGRAPLESGELRPPAGRDRWTDDSYRVGGTGKCFHHFLMSLDMKIGSQKWSNF